MYNRVPTLQEIRTLANTGVATYDQIVALGIAVLVQLALDEAQL